MVRLCTTQSIAAAARVGHARGRTPRCCPTCRRRSLATAILTRKVRAAARVFVSCCARAAAAARQCHLAQRRQVGTAHVKVAEVVCFSSSDHATGRAKRNARTHLLDGRAALVRKPCTIRITSVRLEAKRVQTRSLGTHNSVPHQCRQSSSVGLTLSVVQISHPLDRCVWVSLICSRRDIGLASTGSIAQRVRATRHIELMRVTMAVLDVARL